MATKDKEAKARRGASKVRPRAADRDLSTEEGDPQPVRRSATSRTPGSDRPGGILARGSAWERAHNARLKDRANVHLVRATTFGYYNHRLWREGEEFRMAIDPKLEPPRWVVVIDKPRGEVIGVPKKGGGIEEIDDVLPEELGGAEEMPLDGRGRAARERQQRELEDEAEEEERAVRRRRRATRAAAEGDEEDEEEL